MKTLIVEDDYLSAQLLQQYLSNFGPCSAAANGHEAVEATKDGLEAGQPYDLICMDIMMPEMDGQDALRQIREYEQARGITSTKGVKIIMTTALNELASVKKAYFELCDSYLVKPIEKANLEKELRRLKLIP